MAARELYVEKIEAQLKKLSAMVDDLRNRVDLTSKEARTQLDRISKELKPHERALRRQVNEAKSASNEVWHDLKAGVESAWRDLKEAYDKAMQPSRPPGARARGGGRRSPGGSKAATRKP